MWYVSLLPWLVAAGPLPDDVVTVSARIEAESLSVGQTYEIILDVKFKDGWSGRRAGIKAPILQIDVPPSVKLIGKVLKTYRELSRNEFLQEPFERLAKKRRERISFELIKKPKRGEKFGLSILSYASESPNDAWFIRRRLSLPVAAKATSQPDSSTKSQWGEEDLLQIGDEAPNFELPRADGTTVTLAQFRGKKNVLLSTYRAHW